MTIPEMRAYISEMYGDSWKRKVAKMKDGQVMAIFYCFRNRINKSKRIENKGGVPDAGFARGVSEGEYEQISIDDIMKRK